MNTTLPLSAKLIWFLSVAVVLGFPVTSWLYWPAVLEANVLSPDADSIIIPMFESIVLAAIAAPFIGVVTWLGTRKRPTPLDLIAWRNDRPITSGLLTTGAALPFASGVFLIGEEITAPRGWYGWVWLPYTLTVLFWLVVIRAALLRKQTFR